VPMQVLTSAPYSYTSGTAIYASV
jgi:hypothetical protein